MNKKGNLFMVVVLLANIIIQPLYSLQSVFAEGEEVTIESHQELFEDVELVTEESNDFNIVPPSEQENLVEEVVEQTSGAETSSRLDEVETSDEEEETAEIETEEEVDEEEKEPLTSILYNNSGNAVSNLHTGSKARYSFTVTNSDAILPNAVIRLTLSGESIEAFSSLDDYFPGKGYGSLINAYTANGNFIVDYSIGDLSAEFNRNFDFEFKTIDNGSMTNGQQVLIKAEVIKADNSVAASSGYETYNYVTRQPNFRTEVTYPEESEASDDDEEPAQHSTLIDFFFSMGNDGQGNGSGKSAVTNITVEVDVPGSLDFDASQNTGWSFDEVTRVATYTFAPDSTIFDNEISLPTGLVLINNGEEFEEIVNASALFEFENGETITKTNTPEILLASQSFDAVPTAEVSRNLVSGITLTIDPDSDNPTIVENEKVYEVDLTNDVFFSLKYDFTIPDDLDIYPGDTYEVLIPEIFQTTPVDDLVIKDGEDNEIGTFKIIDNKLTITFSDAVKLADDKKFYVGFSGMFKKKLFDKNNEIPVKIPILDTASFEVTFKPKQQPHEGEDKKEAGKQYVLNGTEKVEVERNPEYVEWTLLVNDSMESIGSAIVKDVLGDNLEIEEETFLDNFKVERIIRNYKNEEIRRELVDVTPVFDSEGFELNLEDIKDAYVITYSTKVIRPDGGGELTIKNQATVILDDDKNTLEDEFIGKWSPDIDTVTKDGEVSKEREDVIDWTVKYNFGKESLGTVTLTDVLSEGSVIPDTVIIQEVETDIDGNMEKNIGDPLEITPDINGTNMTLPDIDANGKAYIITFSSTVKTGLKDAIINNRISDNLGNSDDADVKVNSVPTGRKVGEQSVDDKGRPYIDWTITLNSEKIDVGSITIYDVFNQTHLEFDVTNTNLYTLYKNDEQATNFKIQTHGPNEAGRSGFELTISDVGPNEYKFVYRTYFTELGMLEETVANDADIYFKDYDGNGIGESHVPSVSLDGPLPGITKSAEYVANTDKTEQQIKWTVTFNQSKIMLDAGSKIIDKFTSGNYEFIKDSLEVSPSGINYDLKIDADKKGFEFVINEATDETITLTYMTTTDDAENKDHDNEATLYWQGRNDKATASIGSRSPDITKKGQVVINEDGTKHIEWTIDFNTNKQVIYDFKLVDRYTPSSSVIKDIVVKKDTAVLALGTDYTITEQEAGTFTVNIDKLDAVPYQITYKSELTPEQEKEETRNEAAITFKGGQNDTAFTVPSPELRVEKKAKSLNKETNIISWEITANPNRTVESPNGVHHPNSIVNLVNAVLTDTIPADQRLVEGSVKAVRKDNESIVVPIDQIEQSDNSFTINLPDGPYEWIVTLETKILRHPSVHETKADRYENFVDLANKDYKKVSDTAYIDYFKEGPKNSITKTGEFNDDTENIDWTVTLNPLNLRIVNPIIEDSLNEKDGKPVHYYLEESFNLVDNSGKPLLRGTDYELSFNDDKTTFKITFNKGEINSSISISYSTRVRDDLIGPYTASNAVKLRGGENGIDMETGNNDVPGEQWTYGGGGSGRTLEFTLKKVNNLKESIANTTFEFIRVTAKGDKVPLDNKVTTNEDGIFKLTGVRAGRYIVNEISVPNAYQKLNEPVYIMVSYTTPAEKDAGAGDYKVIVTDSNWKELSGSDVASANGNTLTIVNQFKTTNVTATKIWRGVPTTEDTDLPEAYLQLYRKAYGKDEEAVGEKKFVSGSGEVNVTWDNVEQFTSDGLPYEFYVKEVDADGNVFTPEGYTSQYGKDESGLLEDRLTIINTNAETTEVSVKKVWSDYSNSFKTRPKSIAIYLKQNDKNYDFAIVEPSDPQANEWQHTFTDLPKYDENGEEYVYTVHEVVQNPYTDSIDQATKTITNTYVNDETTSFSGQKVWNDYNDEIGKRPESIIVTLNQNDKPYIKDVEVRSNELGIWSYNFENLPLYDKDGKKFEYSVTETLPKDLLQIYDVAYIDNNIVNTIKRDKVTTTVQGEKIWNDFNNGPGKRPETIQINLLQDGVIIDKYIAQADENGNWQYSFVDLVKYKENGEEYVYTVEEVVNETSENDLDKNWQNYYTSEIDGFDIVNTYSVTEDLQVDISGRKIWNDYSNKFNTRPKSILLVLYRNGVEHSVKQVSASNTSDIWDFSFEGLPKYDDQGNAFVYEVKELTPTPYTSKTEVSEDGTVIITNTYVNTEITSVSGEKIWDDFENRLDSRPDLIIVNLLQNGEAYLEPQIVKADANNKWLYSFTDLPKYDDKGNEYIYSISEEAVPGYTTNIFGSTIINTLQTTTVSGEKSWDDFDNQFESRPSYITVKLMQAVEGSDDPAVMFDSTRVAAIDNWSYEFTNLPVVDKDGNAYIYTIEEEPVAGYEKSIDGTNITNKLITRNISGKKEWVGNDNPYTESPEEITVNLVQTRQGSNSSVVLDSKVVTADDNWEFEFDNIPVFDINGKEYIYSITEEVLPDYSVEIVETEEGFVITNSLILTSVAGEKTWDDWYGTETENNQLTERPESITVNLLQNGIKIADQSVVENELGYWNYEFKNLPKFDPNGKLYEYTIDEVAVDNYETTINGKDIKNTYLNTETTELTGEKVWVDYGNKHNTRPEEITIYLYRNGEETVYRTIMVKDDGDGDDVWKYSFTDLPKYDEDGNPYKYTVDEVAVHPYRKTIEGTTITNTYISEAKVDYSGQKVWNDYQNEFNTRPDSITITLYQNGKKMEGEQYTQVVTPNPAGDWNFTFTGLPKHDEAGYEYQYSVCEDAVDGYETSYQENFILNKVDPIKTAVAGQKYWNDYENKFKTRPDSITINLLRNGEFLESKVVSPDTDGNWFYSFTDLDMHDADGNEYVYTVEEVLPDEIAEIYETNVDGYDIYNTYVNTETVDIRGQKIWNDYSNKFKTRPNSILLVLYRNGVEHSVKQVSASNTSDIWDFSIEGLPKYDEQGNAFKYEVKELTPTPYTSETEVSEDGTVTITNTYVNTEITSVSGEKIWEDFEDYYGLRPDSIEVILYQNNVEFDRVVVEADRLNNWRYSFTELPKYDEHGELYKYTVGDDVHAYAMENYNDDIINTLITVDIEGTKTWNDFNNRYGLRPDSIQVNLNQTVAGADDSIVLHSTEISAANNWSYAFNNVPKFDSKGNEYIYTVTEVAIDGQPLGAYEIDTDGYNLINTLITTEVAVTKEWQDFEDEYGLRPDTITFKLLQNNEEFDAVTVSADENWSYTFENIPKFDAAGNEYEYSVTEDAVNAYDIVVEGYDVINKLITKDIEGIKTWNDLDDYYGLRPEAITVHLVQSIADSSQTRILKSLQVTSETDWKFEFTNVPVYDADGKEYIYTLEEEVNEAYSVEIDNDEYEIINNLKLTDFRGRKTWNDFDDQFGLRPEEITVRLHQALKGSVETNEIFKQVVTAESNWEFIFENLPLVNAEGIEYVYTITEDSVPAYETIIEESSITNNLITLPISGKKVWNDYNNKFGHRPEFITVNLLQNDKKIQSIKVEPNDEGAWNYTFGEVPEFDENGKVYVYTVTEETVDQYNEAEVNGTIITNTYVNTEITSVSGEKIWDDFENRLDSRPDSIIVNLLQNGEAYLEPQIVKADANNKWLYSFTDLPKYDELGEPYVYTVEEVAVEGYETSYGDNGEIINKLIPAISVSVGDYVWFDANKDGLQDDTDVPLANVVLTITNKDGSPVIDIEGLPVGPQVTDENGYYSFDKLPANQTYIVTIDREASKEALKDYTPTKETKGNVTIDSSTWSATSRHLVEDQERDPTLDFGFVLKKVSVGDYVWIDENKDGLQDESDTPLAGIVLTITTKDGQPVKDINGNPVGPTTTDANGKYTFDNLPANETYVVTIDQEASKEALKGLTPTIKEVGMDNSLDSSTWTATSRHLTEDEERDPTLDFGFVRKKVSVGDYVWEDVNRDGLQDETDKPIEGVVLTIKTADGKEVIDINGKPVGPTTTDANGWYTFDNLPADETYVVTIDQAASAEVLKGLMTTLEHVGDNTAKDSSTWTATSRHLTEDEERDPTLDFGFVRPKVSVGDYVWFDQDKDGVQDPNEPGIPNVVLEIRDSEGNPVTDVFGKPVGPTTTDKNGKYSFDNLPIDKIYVVTISPKDPALEGYKPTIEGQGDRETDSSTWSATSDEMLEDGQRDPSLDFGFYIPSGSVGDYVWFDANNDGLQDETDVPLEGVVLTIEDENGQPVTDIFGNPVQSVTTDKNGYYIFDNLPLGHRYTVRIDQTASAEVLKEYETALENQGLDESIDSSSWFAVSVLLTEDGQHDPTLDFGFVAKEVDTETPQKPTTPQKPGQNLPNTGEESWMAYALMILTLGLTFIFYGEKRKQD